MVGFWIGIVITVLVVIGISVVAGRSLSKPKGPMTSHEKITALKASGALKHRKSNRD